jgi:hypothetical protein
LVISGASLQVLLIAFDGGGVLLVEPGEELFVEVFGLEAEDGFDDFGGGLGFGEGVEHFKDLGPAPAFVDVVANAAGLEVADDDLIRVGGADEAAVKGGDGEEFFLLHGPEDLGGDAFAPFRVGGGLFVDGDAFGEPAGNAVVGGLEGEDVAEFVPEGGGPMIGAWFAAGGAVHGDGHDEGDAEGAEAGHAHGADGKVLVHGVELDLDGFGEAEIVLLLEGGEGAFGFALDVRAEEGGFAFVEAEDGALCTEGFVVLEGVEEFEAVGGGGVAEAVLVALLKEFLGFAVVADAHEIDAEAGAGGPVFGLEGDGFAVVGDGLDVAAVEDEPVGDVGVAGAVGGAGVEHSLEPGGFGLIGEQVDGGMDGHGVEGEGVEGEGFVGFFAGFGEVAIFEDEGGNEFLGFEEFGVAFDGLRARSMARRSKPSLRETARPRRAEASSLRSSRASWKSWLDSVTLKRSSRRRPQRTRISGFLGSWTAAMRKAAPAFSNSPRPQKPSAISAGRAESASWRKQARASSGRLSLRNFQHSEGLAAKAAAEKTRESARRRLTVRVPPESERVPGAAR